MMIPFLGPKKRLKKMVQKMLKKEVEKREFALEQAG